MGAVLAVYGLFAIVYNGDGGDTYIKFGSHQVDADIVGAVSLLVALLALASAAMFLRGRRN